MYIFIPYVLGGLDALFFINVYNGFKLCPSMLETVGVRVPTCNFRDFPLFTAAFSNKTCPSARCASVTNTVYKDIDRPIFSNQLVALNHIFK
jgi:hypothetical protein